VSKAASVQLRQTHPPPNSNEREVDDQGSVSENREGGGRRGGDLKNGVRYFGTLRGQQRLDRREGSITRFCSSPAEVVNGTPATVVCANLDRSRQKK